MGTTNNSHVDRIALIKISLDHVKPLIWRRVEVPLTMSLKGLHEVIQAVMQFENYHLFDFHVRVGDQVKRYGIPDPDGFSEVADARNIKIGTLLDRGATEITYCYDFGDCRASTTLSGATTILAGSEAAGVGVSFGFLG